MEVKDLQRNNPDRRTCGARNTQQSFGPVHEATRDSPPRGSTPLVCWKASMNSRERKELLVHPPFFLSHPVNKIIYLRYTPDRGVVRNDMAILSFFQVNHSVPLPNTLPFVTNGDQMGGVRTSADC